MTRPPLRITDAAVERLAALQMLQPVRREIAATEPIEQPLELTLRDHALTLRDPASRGKGLSVDLLRGRMAHRLRAGAVDHEPVVRVARLRQPTPTRILDATAGLGRDALVLALAGCHVTAVERSAVVSALVLDGLHQAQARAAGGAGTTDLVDAITHRLAWQTGEAVDVMRDHTTGHRWDVVYLDPMFAARTKSAAVKQPMQLLQRWLGASDDSAAVELLNASRRAATRRVVVKRPRHAAPLGEVAPDFAHRGRSVRFDVYLRIDRAM